MADNKYLEKIAGFSPKKLLSSASESWNSMLKKKLRHIGATPDHLATAKALRSAKTAARSAEREHLSSWPKCDAARENYDSYGSEKHIPENIIDEYHQAQVLYDKTQSKLHAAIGTRELQAHQHRLDRHGQRVRAMDTRHGINLGLGVAALAGTGFAVNKLSNKRNNKPD